MRDDEDLGEIIFDEIDRFDEALPSLYILRAEAFVNDQCLQTRAFALGNRVRRRCL